MLSRGWYYASRELQRLGNILGNKPISRLDHRRRGLADCFPFMAIGEAAGWEWEEFLMGWDIEGPEEYLDLIRPAAEEWDCQTARKVIDYWTISVDLYCEADCDEKSLVERCGHLGGFGSGGDRICDWFIHNGKDALVFWDALLAIEYQLDGDGPGPKGISRKFDRCTLLFRWAYGPDGASKRESKSTFSPSQLADKINLTLPTVNKYAKKAGVATPSRGKRDHRYSLEDTKKICKQIADSGAENDSKAAKAVLADLENQK